MVELPGTIRAAAAATAAAPAADAPRRGGRRAGLRAAWAAGAALLGLAVAGCTNDVKLREAELQQLAAILPGRYDNREQPPPEGAQGAAGAEVALELNIVEIYAPFLSDHVFYVQENAFGDPRRVLSQRLFVFDVAGEARIRQRTLGFAEPTRWRDGHLNTDLFKGLMGQDVGAAAGACALEWTLGPDSFTGKAPSAGTCIGVSRAELTGRGLTFAEPELRFIRRR
jgi:hypothetical protein